VWCVGVFVVTDLGSRVVSILLFLSWNKTSASLRSLADRQLLLAAKQDINSETFLPAYMAV